MKMGEVRKWEDLNMDCLAQVLGKVGLKHLLEDVPLVCKSWHKASLTPSCWTNLDFSSMVGVAWGPSASNLIKLAVNRSRGSAAKVVLPFNCTFEDLEYVSKECPAVRDLTLHFIDSFNRQVVPSNIIGKFKELQILKIERGYNLDEVVTEIGNNCCNFEKLDVSDTYVRDKVASAIVSSIPNIRYLDLRGSDLSRESLLTILDGCKNLIFLDVRDCSFSDENDQEILKRGSHIKTFELPGSRSSYSSESEYSEYGGYGGYSEDEGGFSYYETLPYEGDPILYEY